MLSISEEEDKPINVQNKDKREGYRKRSQTNLRFEFSPRIEADKSKVRKTQDKKFQRNDKFLKEQKNTKLERNSKREEKVKVEPLKITNR